MVLAAWTEAGRAETLPQTQACSALLYLQKASVQHHGVIDGQGCFRVHPTDSFQLRYQNARLVICSHMPLHTVSYRYMLLHTVAYLHTYPHTVIPSCLSTCRCRPDRRQCGSVCMTSGWMTGFLSSKLSKAAPRKHAFGNPTRRCYDEAQVAHMGACSELIAEAFCIAVREWPTARLEFWFVCVQPGAKFMGTVNCADRRTGGQIKRCIQTFWQRWMCK